MSTTGWDNKEFQVEDQGGLNALEYNDSQDDGNDFNTFGNNDDEGEFQGDQNDNRQWAQDGAQDFDMLNREEENPEQQEDESLQNDEQNNQNSGFINSMKQKLGMSKPRSKTESFNVKNPKDAQKLIKKFGHIMPLTTFMKIMIYHWETFSRKNQIQAYHAEKSVKLLLATMSGGWDKLLTAIRLRYFFLPISAIVDMIENESSFQTLAVSLLKTILLHPVTRFKILDVFKH